MVAEGANLLNENLGTNITLGEKAQDLASKVSKANKEVATAVKGATENIAKGTKAVGKISKGINELSELKTKSDKFMKENSSYLDPNDPDAQQDPNAKQQDPNAQQQEAKKKKTLKEKAESLITKENVAKAKKGLDEANKATGGKYENVIDGAKKVVSGAEKVADYNEKKKLKAETDGANNTNVPNEDGAQATLSNDSNAENNQNQGVEKKKTLKEKIKDVVTTENFKKAQDALDDANKKTDGKYGDTIKGAKAAVFGAEVAVDLKGRSDKKKADAKDPSQDESNSTPTTEPVEEEEEEEEITEDEEAQTIEAIKENIDFALKESKSLNVQFNDVLDISMNTIYQNIASNNKTIDNMIFVINKAENLTEEDKTTVKKEIESIKQRQENLSVNLVDIINGMKESYNTSFKSKIEDGYKNYEKVAIAYVKGDVDEEEFMLAGTMMEKDIHSIDIIPDEGVVTGVNTAMRSLQKQLQTLSNKIRKMEQENQKTNS